MIDALDLDELETWGGFALERLKNPPEAMSVANLNVALIVRYVDRMSAGAARSVRSISGLAAAQGGVAAISDKAAASSARLTKAAAGSAQAADLLTRSTDTLTASTQASGAAAYQTGRQQDQAGRATEAAGRQAEAGARRFTVLERSQMRAAAATRMLKTRAEALEGQLTKLAVLSIGTEGLERAGHFLGHPIAHAVGEAANFAGGMTGFGITAEMSDAQMAPIRKAILMGSYRDILSFGAVIALGTIVGAVIKLLSGAA